MKIIKTKKIHELLPLRFMVKEMYYKDLDEKLLKSGFIWGEHQRSEIPSSNKVVLLRFLRPWLRVLARHCRYESR